MYRRIKALILDFDGLILDTESTDFEAWRIVYAEHGETLPRAEWVTAIGMEWKAFDPLRRLAEITRRPIDEARLHARRRPLRDALIAQLAPLPGVESWLEEARGVGLPVLVASSSPLSWVDGHLRRVDLRHHFADLVTAEQVPKAKPHPDLYERALALLGLGPEEAIAVEDSPNGVASARSAGLRCVAVPGPMTRGLDFAQASLVLDSLAERTLAEALGELFPS